MSRRAVSSRPTVFVVCTDRGRHDERRLDGFYWDDAGVVRSVAKQATAAPGRRSHKCPTCGRDVPWRPETVEKIRPQATRTLDDHGDALTIDVSYL